MKRIKESGGVVFSGRIAGVLAVSRAIGDQQVKGLGLTCMPSVSKEPITEDHKWVVLASDGL